MTAKSAIIERLKGTRWLAIHEFKLTGWSENNIATRLSELTREGKLECRFRKGENFKEWCLATETGREAKKTPVLAQERPSGEGFKSAPAHKTSELREEVKEKDGGSPVGDSLRVSGGESSRNHPAPQFEQLTML